VNIYRAGGICKNKAGDCRSQRLHLESPSGDYLIINQKIITEIAGVSDKVTEIN